MRIRSALLIAALGAVTACAQITAVNGASFLPGKPVSPGSFATIFGENLCDETVAGEWIGLGELPTTLGDCSVSVNGAAAMLSFVSPGQVNFIVPEEAGMGRAEIAVTSGTRVTTGSMVIGRAGPGIFSMNGLGMGEAAILHGKAWHRGPFSATTEGQPTPLAIYATGLDLSVEPVVIIGGVEVEVLFWGEAPGFSGLQQINVMLPPELAGAGRVPLVVISGGTVSNVTYITILPTTEMMNSMPNWVPGKLVKENARRGREASFMAFNAADSTVLVTDEDDDSVRVLSLATGETIATIALPSGSGARHIAVNAGGTLAAVALNEIGAVALIDLAGGANEVISVLPSGVCPSHLVFNGTDLLATAAGSGWVAVIDTASLSVARTVPTGPGAAGIAAAGNLAVVANMQAGTVSLVNLTDWTVEEVALPDGVRPQEVAIAGGKAVITAPVANAFFLLDLATKDVVRVDTPSGARGPSVVAVHNSLTFIANQLSASVTVYDFNGAPAATFPVDPGPRALAVNAAANQLLVLCQGTGTIVVVDLAGYSIVTRLGADETSPDQGAKWVLPTTASITPGSAPVGGFAQVAISGTNLQAVTAIELLVERDNPGKGKGKGRLEEDPNIKVSEMEVNAAGTVLTAKIEILGTAAPGARQVLFKTKKADVAAGTFTVTAN